MNWIKKNLSLVILIALTIATLIIGYLYFCNSYDPKMGNILGGAFVGLLIAIIQFLITIDERSKLDKIKALKVKNVLFHRADEGYYRALIKESKIQLHIMGVTAIRLLQDFADSDSVSSDSKVILDALNRNVNIKILLPLKEHLFNLTDKENFDKAYLQMKRIHEAYPKYFNFRYFNHTPAHSIFNIDDETIVGPVIPDISSKETPGIHILNSSKYAKTFLDYFAKEWENAKTI